VWESVTQVYGAKDFMSKVVDEIMALGYSVTHVFHDTKFMGLPQQRRRVFTVAHKVLIPWSIPDCHPIFVGETIDGVEDIGVFGKIPDRWMKAVVLTPEGKSIRETWIKHEWGKKGRPGFVHIRVSRDKPSNVVTGGWRLFHYSEHRYLSVNELAALCGFPKDYIWTKDGGARVAEMGKGVTPPAGRWLGKIIASALDAGIPTEPFLWRVDYRAKSSRLNDYRIKNIVEQEVR